MYRILFLFTMLSTCLRIGYNQNDLTKVTLSFKIDGSGDFPFQQQAIPPMPGVGIRAGIVMNSTEVEFGFGYFARLFRNNLAGLHHSSIFYSYHHLVPSLQVHQMILKRGPHIFSGSAGVGIIIPKINFADTTMNDGSHKVRTYPTSSNAFTISPHLIASLRYNYLIKPFVMFYSSLQVGVKFVPEYVMPDSPLGAPGANNTYIPPLNTVSLGLNVGIQFNWILDKNAPPKFFNE